MMNWFKSWRRKPAAKLKVETVHEHRLEEIFLNAPNNPLWQGTLAVLDLEVQENLDGAIHEGLTNDQMRFRLGTVAGLLQLKQKLLDYEASARQTQAESERQARKSMG